MSWIEKDIWSFDWLPTATGGEGGYNYVLATTEEDAIAEIKVGFKTEWVERVNWSTLRCEPDKEAFWRRIRLD
jgi:hypothetical protein